MFRKYLETIVTEYLTKPQVPVQFTKLFFYVKLIDVKDGGQAELFTSKKKNNVLLSILSSEATKEDVIN